MGQPLAMNHVGITVPDIAGAVAWYQDVFDCYQLTQIGEAKVDGSYFGEICSDVFKQEFESVLMAHLVTANGAGLEFFQFKKPETVTPENTFKFWQSGIQHIALTTNDIQATVEKIKSKGGKIISKVWPVYKNKPYSFVFCQDPWGTVIELNSAPFEQYFGNTEPFESF